MTVPEESWEGWSRRVAADLAALGEGGWETFAVHPDASTAAGRPPAPRRGGLLRRRPTAPPAMPEVFVQASRVEGLLALECILDPEFEGLTTLSATEVDALASLGWEGTEGEADLARVLPAAAADDAAALVVATLRDVLHAPAPSAVDRRHG